MKLTIISSVDKGGGGFAASRLHQGFVEAGQNSQFYCRDASPSLPASTRFGPPKGKLAAIKRSFNLLRKKRLQDAVRPEFAKLWGVDHSARFGKTAVTQIPVADIWNLHSTFDLFDLHSERHPSSIDLEALH